MPRTGENIYKRKDGRWEARYIASYWENGKPRYKSLYDKTYTGVKQKLYSAVRQQGEELQKRSEMTFERITEDWLSNVRMKVKESTYARYCALTRTHILPRFGKYSVSRMSIAEIEQNINELLLCGRVDGNGGLSAKTVTDILVVMKGIFKYAERNGITISCRMEGIILKKENREMRVLTRQEQSVLTEYLLQDADTMKLGVLLSLYTGIRIGELCALRWEHINLDSQSLHVKHTIQRIQNAPGAENGRTKLLISSPKSRTSLRNIPLPRFLVKILKPKASHSDAYFLSGDEKHIIEPRTMQNRFKSYLNHCGIENANFHCLRHTFSTRCIESGFDLKSLSEILGHSSVTVTLSQYVHSSFELKRENMEKLTL